MTADAIVQRLTAIAAEIEEHTTATWLLEREREELRYLLRKALAGVPSVAEGAAA